MDHEAAEMYPALANLKHAVRTALEPASKSGFQLTIASQPSSAPDLETPDFWEYLAKHPDREKSFSEAMQAIDSVGLVIFASAFSMSWTVSSFEKSMLLTCPIFWGVYA